MKKLLIILMLASFACQGQVKLLDDSTIITNLFYGGNTNYSIGGNAKSIQAQSADSLTGIYSRPSFGEHNICIGRLAGATLTHQNYVVIIGDKSKIDTTKYHDYDIDIDWNWGFFKTYEGRELKGYLTSWHEDITFRSFSGGDNAWNIVRQNHVEQLRLYWEANWVQKVSAYYEKRQHIRPPGYEHEELDTTVGEAVIYVKHHKLPSLEEKLLRYAQECYNDSTKKIIHHEAEYFADGSGNTAYDEIVYIPHRKPTFEGFIEWLKKQK